MNKQKIPLAASLLLILVFSSTGLCAEDAQGVAPCAKRSFKEVKTVTPFSVTHRPQSKKILFDDIICGLKWRDKQCSSGQGAFDAAARVYDYKTLTAIPISKATFVQSPAITSPMGSGLIAFTSAADADQFLAEKGPGKKFTYQEVLRLKVK
ncbi:MAG: nitrous oxide reductase accessory protein NosL [Desulfobulbaceae bacterium]|nr:nitrous oxide reductase accessory protein NosL [Desulfobulbaceae bacterium]